MVNKKMIRESVMAYPGYLHPSTTLTVIDNNTMKIDYNKTIGDLYNSLLTRGNEERDLINNKIVKSVEGKGIFIYDSMYRDYVKVFKMEKSQRSIAFEKIHFHYEDKVVNYVSKDFYFECSGNVFLPTKKSGPIKASNLKYNEYLFTSDRYLDITEANYEFESDLELSGSTIVDNIEKDSVTTPGYRIFTLSGSFDINRSIVVYDATFLD